MSRYSHSDTLKGYEIEILCPLCNAINYARYNIGEQTVFECHSCYLRYKLNVTVEEATIKEGEHLGARD